MSEKYRPIYREAVGDVVRLKPRNWVRQTEEKIAQRAQKPAQIDETPFGVEGIRALQEISPQGIAGRFTDRKSSEDLE